MTHIPKLKVTHDVYTDFKRPPITPSSLLHEMATVTMAGIGAALLVHPIDLVKVRLQMQGELMVPGTYKIIYKNTAQALYQVISHDGFRAIYRGFIPAIFYQSMSQGLRIGIFEVIDETGLTLDENLEASIPKNAVAGLVSGAACSLFASPFYMVKSYMQVMSSSSIAVGHQRTYTRMLPALFAIYRKYPLETGLFRAYRTNMLRISVGSAIQLSTFVSVKNVLLMQSNFTESYLLINMILSTFFASIATAPLLTALDLVRTRMYIQPTDEKGHGLHYKGMIDCVQKIKSKEGIKSFWKGSTATFVYVFITSCFTLLSWDEMRYLRERRRESRDYILDYGYG